MPSFEGLPDGTDARLIQEDITKGFIELEQFKGRPPTVVSSFQACRAASGQMDPGNPLGEPAQGERPGRGWMHPAAAGLAEHSHQSLGHDQAQGIRDQGGLESKVQQTKDRPDRIPGVDRAVDEVTGHGGLGRDRGRRESRRRR